MVALMLAGWTVACASFAGDGPLVLRPGPHLFVDDFLLERAWRVAREVCPPQRHPANPVVTGPEDRCFQPYMTVLRDPQTGRFRIWYGVPENASQSHLATMESADGIVWRRPHRVLEDPGRIQFGCSVLDEGPAYPDPGRRYKYAWWNDGGLNVAASPDGLSWTRMAPGVVLRHNHDINNIYWDPVRRRYVANVSIYTEGPTWTGTRRVTYQSVSHDLLTWSPPKPIVTPDARDEGETQFYCMGGVLARGGLLIGMVRVLRDDLPADPGGPVAGIGYTTLAWSRDGETWTRDRVPFLDRAPSGAWDHAMAWIDCQLPVGDSVYLYYGGYRRGHKVERFTERQIGLATMRRDRHVARVAGDAPGTLRTRLVRLDARSMTVNADARGGDLRVRILDERGRAIPGYGWPDGALVRGDGVAIPVRWARPLRDLRGRLVRIEFRLHRSRLYAFDLD